MSDLALMSYHEHIKGVSVPPLCSLDQIEISVDFVYSVRIRMSGNSYLQVPTKAKS
jgi:hypothetical protein